MEDHEKETPGAGQHTGGKGEDRAGHQVIIGDSIAPDATVADQKDLLPDADAIREALRYLHPEGSWMVNAKTAKGMPGSIGADLDAAVQWAVEQNGAHRRNTYMAPARLRPDYALPKKAKDVDVSGSRWLWADLDPDKKDKSLPFAARQAACLARLTTERPADVPAPSAVIFSGGGYWGLWRLAVEVDSARLRAMLKWLAEKLGGDKTTDPSRIMRLPGTVNWPSDDKRAAGQVPALAKFVSWNGVEHPLSAFGVSKGEGPTGGAAEVELPRDLPKIDSLDVLPAAVSDRTKMLITNGDDPDDPTKYPSRSEALFAVLCELVRADVADDVIAAVILDPDFGVSAHVLKQPRPRDYAQRQIQRARDKAVDPWLLRLNDRHTVLGNQGGKCRILEFTRRPTGIRGQTRAVVSLQSFEDFRNRYMNNSVVVGQDKDGKDVKMPVGKWWLQNEHRREFHSLVFSPRDGEVVEAESGDPDERQLNLWRGFAVKPAPGDWSLMRAHIRDILAGGDEASDNYIVRWMAWTVQNPDRPAEVALAFRGEMGTGKGIFGRMMARLFGQHGLHTGGTELISGRFNQHLADCCLLFADEILWDGDKKAEARMKVYLTEETIVIEGKGVDAAAWPNMLHVIMSSNSEWVVPAGRHERRYAVFDVSSAQRQKKEYFKPLFAQMDAGGLAAMLHDMLAMDLGDWHPRQDRPETAALADQKSRGLGPVEGTVLDWLRENAMPSELVTGDRRGTDARPFIYTTDVAEHIRAATREPVTMNMVSKVLKQIGAEGSRKDRPSGYLMPTLGDARRAWNDHPDLPKQEWDDEEHWPGTPF